MNKKLKLKGVIFCDKCDSPIAFDFYGLQYYYGKIKLKPSRKHNLCIDCDI